MRKMQFFNRISCIVLIVILLLGLSVSASIINKQNVKNYNILNIDNGLVGYWSFNEGTGNTAYDDSGNGNNGIIIGPSWITGIFDDGLKFNGKNDYVEIADDDSLSFGDGSDDSPFTILAWIKRDETGVQHIILSKYNTLNYPVKDDQEYIFNCYNDDKLRITLFDKTGDYRLSINTNEMIDTDWHFVAATYDGSESVNGLKLYIDGIQKSTSIVQNDPSYVAMHNTPESLKIGVVTIGINGHNFHFKGSIDEVRVYNKVLTSQEIQMLYENPSGLKTTFIFGKINDLTTGEGNFITFSAVKIRCIQFFPFQFFQLASNENIRVSKDYIGIIAASFATGLYKTNLI